MNFGQKIKEVVENHVKAMEDMDNQGKALEKKFRSEEITGRNYNEQREAIESKRAAAIVATQQEINRLHQAHDKAVDEWNALDGSKLHADAELLKMDIPMSQVQYQQLCDKHRDNSLMLSLLAQYADRHQDQPLFADRPADAATRKSEFADYCERAIGTCRGHNSLAAAMFLDGLSVPPSVMYEY